MSYGALSPNAVRALSRGAKMAGCYMSTGEGSLSPYHVEGGLRHPVSDWAREVRLPHA